MGPQTLEIVPTWSLRESLGLPLVITLNPNPKPQTLDYNPKTLGPIKQNLGILQGLKQLEIYVGVYKDYRSYSIKSLKRDILGVI